VSYISQIASEIAAELPQELLPDEHADELMLLYAVLATSVGTAVTSEQVHDAWVAWMTYRGENHRSMVPFDQLSQDVQREDEPFAQAIRRVAERRGLATPKAHG
jgi:hypothetical protein